MSTTRANFGESSWALAAATTPRAMRQANRAKLLDAAWNMDGTFTASDLIAASGLTRATVLQVCRDLQERGWIREAPGTAATSPGRQALRFDFHRTRNHILGADIGRRSLTVAVADLTGTIVGRASRRFAETDTASRSDRFEEVAQSALDEAGLSPDDVVAACIGVAAPITADGTPIAPSWFWESVTVDPKELQQRHAGWRVQVENDANLAALAEARDSDLDESDAFLTLLSGERLGAGLILGGRLHRGAHGAAGEMEYLQHVAGVDGSHGIALMARMFAVEALAAGRSSSLRPAFEAAVGEIPAVDVLRAADEGDDLAREVVERIGERIALTISTAAGLIDPSTVVIAGGIAQSSGLVLEAVRRRLPSLLPTTPPHVVLSTLGRDVVLRGALRQAGNEVRRLALTGDR